MRSRRWSGSSSANCPNHGCACASGVSMLLEQADALAALVLRAQDGLRDAGPAAHHAERVAHRDESGLVVLPDVFEQAEELRLPGGILLDALAALAARR